MNKKMFKMTPEQLSLWQGLKRKCVVHKSKKDYCRKDKHKKSFETDY